MAIWEWIQNHSLYILLTVSTLFNWFWLAYTKERLATNRIVAFFLALIYTFLGVLCVKVFAFIESFEFGGMSLYGAVFFLPLLFYLTAKLFKKSLSDTFDCFTVCAVFTLLCARINCMMSGCCLGKDIPGTSGFRWPTRELEILFYVVLLILLIRWDAKGANKGILYPSFMLFYGFFRFIVEFFRVSGHMFGVFHISHLWSVVSVIIGLSIYLEIKSQNKKKEEGK